MLFCTCEILSQKKKKEFKTGLMTWFILLLFLYVIKFLGKCNRAEGGNFDGEKSFEVSISSTLG